MEIFILRAFLIVVGISVITGSLGCFVIWKRMSYFSESIAHSALLGVSLGLVSGLGVHFGLVMVSALFAVFIVFLKQQQLLSNDAILGISSHIALSLGIIVLGFVSDAGTDYFSFLFGDILSITNRDIIWVYLVMLVVIALLGWFWQGLLLLTLNEDLARAEGLPRVRYQLLLMLLIALAISVSVQIIGILLVTSLLVIPPAIARVFAKSPKTMVLQSISISIIAVLIGLKASIQLDIATGPAIVVVLGVLFVLTQLAPALRQG